VCCSPDAEVPLELGEVDGADENNPHCSDDDAPPRNNETNASFHSIFCIVSAPKLDGAGMLGPHQPGAAQGASSPNCAAPYRRPIGTAAIISSSWVVLESMYFCLPVRNMALCRRLKLSPP
jgi:hypothetical protein